MKPGYISCTIYSYVFMVPDIPEVHFMKPDIPDVHFMVIFCWLVL